MGVVYPLLPAAQPIACDIRNLELQTLKPNSNWTSYLLLPRCTGCLMEACSRATSLSTSASLTAASATCALYRQYCPLHTLAAGARAPHTDISSSRVAQPHTQVFKTVQKAQHKAHDQLLGPKRQQAAATMGQQYLLLVLLAAAAAAAQQPSPQHLRLHCCCSVWTALRASPQGCCTARRGPK